MGQQQAQTIIAQPTNQNTYLGIAICSIFCCWPLAIVAILYAMKANTAFSVGNVSEGISSASTARNVGICAIVSGVVIYVVFVPVYIFVIAASAYYPYG